ncbi:2',5' RNA ligase [mine drainage metagenome]|uniref:2',5' RNA ligase n=1 Tax=mine drainage metagenome TaxID=410659 RepID=T1D135_9ZZZZ
MSDEHYFLALWPDCARALEIERLTRPFWESIPNARPVSPPNYHLTLAFLGSLPPEAPGAIAALVDPLKPPGFDLMLKRLGWFRQAEILYFAPSVIPDALGALAATLQSRLADAGFRRGRDGSATPEPFVPHVTLARSVREWTGGRPAPVLGWSVNRLCLARSHPGCDYEILSEWRLSGLEDGAECGIIMGQDQTSNAGSPHDG